ncbi:monooxygenase [Hortaea werneckii]|uniref:FAD-binding domain-containing protein n=1 Tax=Hortaea werneckii TaxID=91943 RepID=A0A3M7BV30_HORWE|nr:monooxygenase [Hortaea werneckii]RMY43360.1 hypothetical protein D0865_11307 [Hortaea werneckii]
MAADNFAQNINTKGGATASADDVKIAPPSGISVLIVGAGVGGLMAALECHRKGHNVRILERSHNASAGGDMFTIGLNGRMAINHYPTMKRELDHISIHDGWMRHRKFTGDNIGEPVPMSKMVPAGAGDPIDRQPMMIQLRPLFHAMLYHQLERFGIDVVYGKKVVRYYEDASRGIGGVETDNGENFEADLVFAGDGLNSKSHSIVMGGQGKTQPSGRSIFRAAWPLETAMKDPLVKEYFGLKDGKDPQMQAWMGPNTHSMALSYVDKARDNGLMCWGYTYTEPAGSKGQDTTQDWSRTVSTSEVLEMMNKAPAPGWNDAMHALVRTIPENSIVYWPLLWRDPTPCVHSAGCRVLQIGDAAHTLLPNSGFGASMAIEDAVTIATCLQKAGKDSIETAVKTHALLRADRVSTTQLLGFVNSERFQKTDLNKVGNDKSKVAAKVPKWIYQLDPEKYAEEKYEAAAASLKEGGKPFVNTNLPDGFTPRPWTLEGIEMMEAEGKSIELEGDWS